MTTHVVVADRYPTEQDAREAFSPLPVGDYFGRWRAPYPGKPLMHVFTDEPAEVPARGWTKEES